MHSPKEAKGVVPKPAFRFPWLLGDLSIDLEILGYELIWIGKTLFKLRCQLPIGRRI
jgi:hypothetical protein